MTRSIIPPITRRMEKGKCYEVTFGYGYPESVRQNFKIIGEPTEHGVCAVSYPTITPHKDSWKKGWATYFRYIWDKGHTCQTWNRDHSLIEFRELKGEEIEEFKFLLKLSGRS